MEPIHPEVVVRSLVQAGRDMVPPLTQGVDADAFLASWFDSQALWDVLRPMADADVYDPAYDRVFDEQGALRGLAAFRQLRSSLGMRLGVFVQQLAILIDAFDPGPGKNWQGLAEQVNRSPRREDKLLPLLKAGRLGDRYTALEEELVVRHPHAIYPTSPFREGQGHVVARYDFQQVDAVMSSRTFTSIRVVEGVLNPRRQVLREVYQPLGRCVCLVDQNVEEHFGQDIEAYFEHHQIPLEKLVYRAMEVDKGIGTVEKMLGDFKRLGVSRNEPVLIVGGGVLSDAGGLAAALYHRGTPYVMLSTSVVAGIDAGPSPRTCCDGFGYKNLFGAYHTPILSITDRTFFRTLHPGWLRHGIAEIIKMACVKDDELFAALEDAGPELIETRFGSAEPDPHAPIHAASQRILGRAIKSYVEAEYGNLYETHQCRPHAFGHTWSPGFEIPAGLLHGHAVGIGMGFGAFLSHRLGWIEEAELTRITDLIAKFGLSLNHDVLGDSELLWASQVKMTEKRGGHLAAPLPKGRIGACGYLNELSRDELDAALADYRLWCERYPNRGHGVEPHCHDVGLEDPSTVGGSLVESD
ncbi:MAG: sedoheptulose 7-phosphate cyclase [Planctomycetota bacterium]